MAVLATASGACLTGRAQTPAERPALDVPPPPSRAIPQLPAPETSTPPEPTEETSTAKPSAPNRNPRPPATKDPQKPDPKPETPPADPVPTPPQPQTPPLRLPQAGDSTAVARQVTDIIERTRRTLNGIDYGSLSNIRKKAYDDAKLFAQQAEDALKASNLVFARELADKAERLAKELQK